MAESYSYDYTNYSNLAIPSTPSVWEPGKDDRLVPALDFDHASNGRSLSSPCTLVNLPVEIMRLIVKHISREALRNFAMANSDCRQLARSRQFTSILFNYDQVSFAIIDSLRADALPRSMLDSTRVFLGSCIRRITITTVDRWVWSRHGLTMEDQMDLPQLEQSQRVLRANCTYYSSYLPSILNLIANRTVFPHLESLDFEDDIVLRPSFFDAIRQSTIKHLKIKRADIEKPYTISQSTSLGGVPWPLQSLSLNINPLTEDVDISSLCNSILRACAPTLKYLEWSTDLFRPLLRTTPSQVILQFPYLRHLRLRGLTFSDSSLLGALLSAKLVSLELRSIEFMDPEDVGFFSNMGAIETLQTLVWHPQGLDEPGRAEFLLVNQQISKLSLPGPEAPEFLEQEVLPLLVSSFTNLRSLSLVVEGDGFSANARNKIRAIYQLEQLHLSAMKDPDPYWPIAHLPSPEKPAHLTDPEERARIPSLKRLAFSRDSYRYTQEQDHNEYYANGDGGYTAMWRSAFETTHRRDMLRLALQYHPCVNRGACVEWIFIGQLQIEMTHEKYLTPTDRLLTSVRNESTWLLEEMFGCEGLAPV